MPTHIVRDPADTTRAVAEVQWHTADDVSRAVDAALAAGSAWAGRTAAERANLLLATAAIVDERRESLATAMTAEEGKLIEDARGEVDRASALLRYFANAALLPNGSLLPAEKRSAITMTRRIPVGVIALVTPFNYPLLVPAWKLAPALAFGNTVVWKCSEYASLAALAFTECFRDAGLPDGVLTLIVGDAEPSKALVADARINALSFTGSTAAGHAVRAIATANGARVQLELGGSNPAVVLADADLDAAAMHIAKGAFSASGQKCAAIRRVIVMREQHDALLRRVIEIVRSWKLGPGSDPEVVIAPLASPAQRQRVLDGIAATLASGATLALGGGAPTDPSLVNGNFVEPTIFTDVTSSTYTWCEEIFGPVLSFIAVDSAAEALQVANATPFGLNAGVFTRDLSAAVEFGQHLRAGMVHINAVSGFPIHVPFGGVDDSGFGPLEQGPTSVEFFTDTVVLNIHPNA